MYNELEVTAMEIIKNEMHRGKSFNIHEQSDSDLQDTIKLSTIHIIEIQKERERIDSKKKKKKKKKHLKKEMAIFSNLMKIISNLENNIQIP